MKRMQLIVTILVMAGGVLSLFTARELVPRVFPGVMGIGLIVQYYFLVRTLKEVTASPTGLLVSSNGTTFKVPYDQVVNVVNSWTLRTPCLRVDYKDENGVEQDFRFIPSLSAEEDIRRYLLAKRLGS